MDSTSLSIRQMHSLPPVLSPLVSEQAKRYLAPDQGHLLVASLDGQPVGLVLIRIESLTFLGEIEALGVLDSYRGRGIGTALLIAAEEEIKQSKCLMAMIVWETNDSLSLHLKKILKQRDWHNPQPFILRYHFDVQAFHPIWFEKTRPLSTIYELFPWQQVTTKERYTIDHQLSEGTYPVSVYPFGDDESLIDPINSFGLRYQGVVIGWMITHRISPDTIRYSHLYIQDDYRYRGVSIGLLAHSIRCQQASTVPYAIFEVRLSQANKRWQGFVDRRLAPLAKAVSGKEMAWKDLRSTSASDS